MKSFTLELHDTSHAEQFADVTSFVGEDASGSFGILANHTRMMTVLVLGLARFRIAELAWQYIAMPGALLYFKNNHLTLSTRHFMIDEDYMRISQALEQKLLQEEIQLRQQKQSLRRMEEELLKRLWETGRTGP